MVAALRETEEEAGIGKRHLEVGEENEDLEDDDGEDEDDHLELEAALGETQEEASIGKRHLEVNL